MNDAPQQPPDEGKGKVTQETKDAAHGLLAALMELPTAQRRALIATVMTVFGLIPAWNVVNDLLTVGPRVARVEQQQAEQIQQLEQARVEMRALRTAHDSTRSSIDDMNLQIANITCRTERALDPQTCDIIREQVRDLLRRAARSR